eukprot:NODE_302_length_10333_cov_0.506840.p3 type:complete len:520 gc:universal NODE_302_length_10333_cov_0.506840:4761-3202(-)
MSEAPKKDYSTDPGPIKDRKVKDIIWLVLFIAVWIALFIISGFAISKGNVKRLKYGRDYLGNLCGDVTKLSLTDKTYDFDFTSKKYLYYVDLGINSSPDSICVEKCPSPDGTLIKDKVYDNQYKSLPSEYQVNFTVPVPYYNVASHAYRCIPTSNVVVNVTGVKFLSSNFQSDSEATASSDQNNMDALSNIWSSLSDSVGYIALSLLIGTGLSILWLFIIQIFGKIMVWFTLTVTNLAFFGLGAFFLVHWHNAQIGKTSPSGKHLNQNIMLGAGITSVVVGFLLLCVSLFLRKRIILAIDLMHQASIALRHLPALMLVPLIKYIILVGVFAWSLFIMSLLASSGDLIADAAVQGSARLRNKYSPNQVLNYLQLFYLFGTFWTWNFIIAIAETITAGAVAQWYWTQDKKALPKDTVWRSVVRTLKYHLGSLALGSLLIALLQTLRVVIGYLQLQAKKAKNLTLKRILGCLACCFACFEKVLKFMNTNAYIEVFCYLFRLQSTDTVFAREPGRLFIFYGEI